MNAVILKYNTDKGNYWGNDAHPNGISLQTLRSITQAVVDVASSVGSIYVYRVGRAPEFFGPMNCAPEIIRERGSFYRLLLKGNLVNNSTGFLNGAITTRVLRTLDLSQGVLIQGHNVRPLHFDDDQPAELKLLPPFILVDPA